MVDLERVGGLDQLGAIVLGTQQGVFPSLGYPRVVLLP